MADQRKKAGNIGDVVKHAVLAEVVACWPESEKGEFRYLESHAGYYEYPLASLRPEGVWDGERAWSLGVLASHLKESAPSGYYETVLARELHSSVYPGSIKLVHRVLGSLSRRILIRGYDLGQSVIDSYPAALGEFCKADGYAGALKHGRDCTLVFCDPFWKDVSTDREKCEQLLQNLPRVLIWYPLSSATSSLRTWIRRTGLSFVEAEYCCYAVSPWAGQNLCGCGLLLHGLPSSAMIAAKRACEHLQSVFAGKTVSGRRLDLSICSCLPAD